MLSATMATHTTTVRNDGRYAKAAIPSQGLTRISGPSAGTSAASATAGDHCPIFAAIRYGPLANTRSGHHAAAVSTKASAADAIPNSRPPATAAGSHTTGNTSHRAVRG